MSEFKSLNGAGARDPEQEDPMEVFYREIAALAADESLSAGHFKKEGEGHFPPGSPKHFEEADFDPRELTEADRAIYEKFKAGNITAKEANNHLLRIVAEERRDGNLKESSRHMFAEFICNRAGVNKGYAEEVKEKMKRGER